MLEIRAMSRIPVARRFCRNILYTNCTNPSFSEHHLCKQNSQHFSASAEITGIQQKYFIKRNVVVTRLSARKMKTLRALQISSHAVITTLVGLNFSTLAHSAYQLYKNPAIQDPNIYFNTGLLLPTFLFILVPVVSSSIIGRLELNSIKRTVKVSHLDLFGRRCEKTVALENCHFSREHKACKLDKSTANIQFPYFVLWQSCVEEAAEYLSSYTGGKLDESFKFTDQYETYPRFSSREQKYIQIIGLIVMLSLTVRTYQMKNKMNTDELKVLFN